MSDTVSKDNTLRALGVALAVAFVCALLVSVVAVSLRPVHRANIEAERIAQLELVLAALSDIGRAQTIDSLEARLVDLETGAFDDSTDPTAFDADRAASKPATSVAIPAELDLAGLKRRALLAQVYLVRGSGNAIDLIILPVSGRGYQSTLRAWLVLDGDARTVRALKFYQHGETPGVGARIEEPEWEAHCVSASGRMAPATATTRNTRSTAFPEPPAPPRASTACCVSGSAISALSHFYNVYARTDSDAGE
jgi:Na+-transporting NADH:ubiquinone oxidoreductase subunit C